MPEPQTVATTSDAGAKPQAEEQGAQEPSIDELLKQFEATETPPEQPEEIKADDLKDFVREAKADREDRLREKTNQDVATAAKVVKGDLDLDDDVVIDLLYGKANRDPRFLRAFQMRHENPSGWEGVQRAFSRELASKMVRPDQNLTDDIAAVTAAVRSASTGSSDEAPPDFGSMSDAEFNAWQRKNIK